MDESSIPRAIGDLGRRLDDLHRHFDVVGESLRGDIRLVAQGVIAPDQGLDGRVTVLEVDVSDVRTRLERLEPEDRV